MKAVDPRYFKSDIPPGQSGEWCLERYEIKADDAYDPKRDNRPDFAKRRPGSYTRLERGTTTFMTDLYEEWWTQKLAIDQAGVRGGNVLITGLGLGVIVESLLKPDDSQVQHVTVIERSEHVVALVAEHLETRYDQRLSIVNADAFTWTPPSDARFTLAWHDIWPSPEGDEVTRQMAQLEQHYQKYCDWQGHWPAEFRSEFREPTVESSVPVTA